MRVSEGDWHNYPLVVSSEQMEAHDVSMLVNSPENDSMACIVPASPRQVGNLTLPF